MKGNSFVALSLMLALSGCGGSSDDVSKNEQPWLSGQLPAEGGDGSDGVAENVAPELLVDFNALSEASFGQEVSIPVYPEDADGDEVSLSLYGAPDWLAWSPELGVIKGTVDEVGNFASFQVIAIDSEGNESEVVSSPQFNIQTPEQFTLDVKLPINISAGDSVNMYFVDTTEESEAITFGALVDELGVAKFEGFRSDFDTYEGRTLVVEWQSQNYVPLFNIVGSASIIKNELNSKLELSSDAFLKMAPTVKSAAYYHLLQKYSSRPGNTHVVGADSASNYHGAFAGQTYKDMVGYYAMTQEYGELYGLNDVLRIDLFTGHELEVDGQKAGLPFIHEPIEDVALEREITRERLNYDSSVSGRLWEDLLEKESQDEIKSGLGFTVTPDEWVLTFSSSSLYGDSEGVVITLNDDKTSQIVADGERVEGNWVSSPTAGEYAFESSFKGLTADTFNYSIDELPKVLFDLGMEQSDVDKYVEKALNEGLNFVDLSLVKNAGLSFMSHYSPFDNVSIGEVTLHSVVSILGDSVDVTKTQGAHLSKSKKTDLDNWSFDNSIYEVILKLPGSDEYQWLDLYLDENVEFNKNTKNKPEENWKWSYDEGNNVLKLSTFEGSTELVSKYIIEREPSMHLFNAGDINARVYGVRNVVERNGEVVSDGLSSLILHPTARCEFYTDDTPPCAFSVVQPSNALNDSDSFKFWFDTSLGALKLGSEYDGQSFIYIADLENAPEGSELVDYRIFSLESSNECENIDEDALCFVSSSNEKALDTANYDRWVVGTKEWYPIYVTGNEMIVMTESGEVKTYIALDPVKMFGNVTINLSW